jgi:hypothetical protein
MKIAVIATCALLLFGNFVGAQTLGEFKPKENRGALGPRKFTSKDVYIANFSVNFQLYNLKTTSTKGGFANRMLSGNTKASLAVGLDIPTDILQKITDEAYRSFVSDLQSKGFNVLNGDMAANTKFYKGYQRYENLGMRLSQAPGMVTVYPTNTIFYFKGFTKSGQKKQGGISGGLNRLSNDDGRNSITKEIAKYPKLSAELDNATIINADMYILFIDVKKPYQGSGAKITANTKLRMASYEHIKSQSLNSSKEVNYLCVSAIDFIQGRNKIGGSPLGTYSGVLKNDLAINEVIGKEKIQAYAKTNHDYLGTETAFGRVYRVENISVENIATIHTDPNKYATGIISALNTFLSHHLNVFKNKFF